MESCITSSMDFRHGGSCETQLVMLVEDLARRASGGKQTDLILLDFSKAVDKVNHLSGNYTIIESEAVCWAGSVPSLVTDHRELSSRESLSWGRYCSLFI